MNPFEKSVHEERVALSSHPLEPFQIRKHFCKSVQNKLLRKSFIYFLIFVFERNNVIINIVIINATSRMINIELKIKTTAKINGNSTDIKILFLVLIAVLPNSLIWPNFM